MRFSPSAASRWMTCPGSVRMSEGIVLPPSEYAVEGTAAHQLLEFCQRFDFEPQVYVGQTLETKDGNVVVTEDMAEAVGLFLSEIANLPAASSRIEMRLDSKAIVGLGGTADYVNVVGSELHLYDYKHGAGVPVQVEGNKQLLTYAGLAMEHFGHAEKVVLKIIQPRAESYGGDDGPKVKAWEVTPVQVREHMQAVAETVEIAKSEIAPLVPGDHCRWCPAKTKCPKLHQLSVAEAKDDFRLPSPVELTEEKILFLLDYAPVLEDFLRGVKEHARRLVESGANLPGWKLVESIGNRRWDGNDEKIGETLVSLGFHQDDLFEPAVLKSPSQIEKVRPSGMKAKDAKQLVDSLTYRPVNGTSLVREGDRRPAVTSKAANDFTRIES